jgi:hypothetical protein
MLVLLSAPPALALDTGGEAYQSVLIDSALRAKGLVPEPAPAGKQGGFATPRPTPRSEQSVGETRTPRGPDDGFFSFQKGGAWDPNFFGYNPTALADWMPTLRAELKRPRKTLPVVGYSYFISGRFQCEIPRDEDNDTPNFRRAIIHYAWSQGHVLPAITDPAPGEEKGRLIIDVNPDW